jgi:hypothetical protein
MARQVDCEVDFDELQVGDVFYYPGWSKAQREKASYTVVRILDTGVFHLNQGDQKGITYHKSSFLAVPWCYSRLGFTPKKGFAKFITKTEKQSELHTTSS